MSLESTIADLVTKTTNLLDYFNNKKAGIDSAVAAAIAAVPANLKVFYVNQLTGVDTNVGSTSAPLKTLDRALYNTPVGGVCRVYLQDDYTMLSNINVDGRFLTVFSDVTGVRRKLNTTYYVAADGTANYLSGFPVMNGGQIMFQDVTINIPSSVGLAIPPVGFTNSVFKTTSNGGTPLVAVKLTQCEVIAPGDFSGAVMGIPNSAVIFEVLAVTFPANFGGRYVYGVAAGTAANTLSNVLTNLSTL
ncbi:hypothetical protein [Pseudomonas sp. NPDC087626]|uniref:hypothetical protein n=1 Tax=Pseudomonas sp. NPDC087626 TaxID=3364444 RepID=UPI003823D7DF